MSGLPVPVEPTEPRPPRYFVFRVVGCERDFTPTHVTVERGPYPTLIAAWHGAGMHRRELETGLFIAGDMDLAVETEIKWRSIPS